MKEKFHIRLANPWIESTNLQEFKTELEKQGFKVRDNDCTRIDYHLDVLNLSREEVESVLTQVKEQMIRTRYVRWDEGRVPRIEARSRWNDWETQTILKNNPL